jgi:hypothetical protein
MSHAPRLFRSVGLDPQGPVTWGTPIPERGPGVYVIETPTALATAPLDETVIAGWLRRVPGLTVDGMRPTPSVLAARLASFWIPGETVVYIGLAGTSVATRVRQYYTTPLGDRRPHAGGHWLKTLANLPELRIWWAATDDPAGMEDELLNAFAASVSGGAGLVLPFANLETAGKVRKPHGIRGSVIRDVPSAHAPVPRVVRASPVAVASTTGSSRIDTINQALARLAAEAGGRISAVDAAAGLDRLGLLRDSHSRPGLPLRKLLRAGRTANAHREGVFWFITSTGRTH